MPGVDNTPVNISMYVTYKKILDYFLMMNFLSWNHWVNLKRHFQGFLSTIPSGLYSAYSPEDCLLPTIFLNWRITSQAWFTQCWCRCSGEVLWSPAGSGVTQPQSSLCHLLGIWGWWASFTLMIPRHFKHSLPQSEHLPTRVCSDSNSSSIQPGS